MRQKNVFLFLFVMLTCVACSSTLPSFKSYKLDIQQGNVVTSKMMDQVRPGMSKSQVRYVLGTPLIQDTFHRDRWDYLYQYRHENKITQQNRVILYFKDDVLINIAGDPIPEGTLDPASLPKSDVMLEQADKRTFVEKLKFWNAPKTESSTTLAAKGVSDKADEPSLLDKLKFWKSSEAEVTSNTTKAKESVSDVQAQAKEMVEPAQVTKPETPSSEQVAESTPNNNATAKTEEEATSSLLAVPIEAVAAASVAATEQSTQLAEVAQTAKETVAEVVAPAVAATAVANVPAEPEPQTPAPVVEAKPVIEATPVIEQKPVVEATPVVVPPKEVVEVAPETPPVATIVENKTEMPETDEVYQSYNAQLESPTLLLDKKLKKLSDKPIAKINATPDIPPQLRLSRTLADAPSMVDPVSEVPLKPSPAAKVPSSPDTSEPGIFERMLEKIGF